MATATSFRWSEGSQAAYSPDGRSLFFTRWDRQWSETKRYKGGWARSIWRFDGLGEAVNLTPDWAGTSNNPMYWSSRVYFLSNREMGVYGPEGEWLIEGHGVDPGIIVDNLPNATFTGSDAQLQAALDLLKQEIKADPRPGPKAPPYPDKSFITNSSSRSPDKRAGQFRLRINPLFESLSGCPRYGI